MKKDTQQTQESKEKKAPAIKTNTSQPPQQEPILKDGQFLSYDDYRFNYSLP